MLEATYAAARAGSFELPVMAFAQFNEIDSSTCFPCYQLTVSIPDTPPNVLLARNFYCNDLAAENQDVNGRLIS